MINKVMISVSAFSIVGCMIFFAVAFGLTRPGRGYTVPVVNVTVASENEARAITNSVLCSVEYQDKLRTALVDRESIVRAEHAQFRAELGTWLSIFGLLAILATIMVAAFSFACQQSSLQNDKEELKDQVTILNKRFDELKHDFEREVKEKESQIVHAGEAVKAEVFSDVESISQTGDCGDMLPWMKELMPVQDKSKAFVKIWSGSDSGDKWVSEKIEMGISALIEFNALIDKYLAEAEIVIEILKKLNLFNIYLGQRTVKGSDFYKNFVEELRVKRPLKVSCETLTRTLEHSDNGMLIAGYYTRIYKLQEMSI